jgi:hypothetical protein
LGIRTLNGLGSWSAWGCIGWLPRGIRGMTIVDAMQVVIELMQYRRKLRDQQKKTNNTKEN